MHDDMNQRNMEWHYKFCWWPERCSISGRSVWLRWGYYGFRTNYYRPEVLYTWHDKLEHVFWLIRTRQA
jgi:hypothetical protein